MWSQPRTFLWPAAWLSLWLDSVAIATAATLSAMHAHRGPLRLRTPLLRLHVSTLKPRLFAGLQRRKEWRTSPLHPVMRDCEDN